MPTLSFRCPSCDALLRVDAANAGRKAKCKACGETIAIPQSRTATRPGTPKPAESAAIDPNELPTEEYPVAESDPATPTADEATSPKRRRKRLQADDEEEDTEDSPPRPALREPDAWHRVSLGLLLLIISIIGSVLMMVVLQGQFMLLQASSRFALLGGTFVMVGSLIISVLANLTTIAGYGLCCFVPRRFANPNKPLAALILAAVGFLSSTGDLAWNMISTRSAMDFSTPSMSEYEKIQKDDKLSAEEKLKRIQEISNAQIKESNEWMEKFQEEQKKNEIWTRLRSILIHLQTLLRAAQVLVFLFFLRELASALRDPETAANCETLIKLSLGLLLAGIVMGLVSGAISFVSARFLHQVTMMLLGILGLLGLAVQVWFVIILFTMRGLVARGENVKRKKKRE